MIKLTDVLNEIKINSPSSIIPLKVYREHVFNYFKDKVPNPGLFKNELEEAKDVADIDEKIEKYDPNISDVFEMMYDFIDTVVK